MVSSITFDIFQALVIRLQLPKCFHSCARKYAISKCSWPDAFLRQISSFQSDGMHHPREQRKFPEMETMDPLNFVAQPGS